MIALAPRPFAIFGFAVLLATSVPMALFTSSTPIPVVMVLLFVNGLGMGLWNVPNNSQIMGSVPTSMLGVVGAFSNLTRNVGNVTGQAVASGVVVAVMVSQGFDVPLSEIGDSAGAGVAFMDGWRLAYILVVIYSTVGLVARVPNEAPVRARRAPRPLSRARPAASSTVRGRTRRMATRPTRGGAPRGSAMTRPTVRLRQLALALAPLVLALAACGGGDELSDALDGLTLNDLSVMVLEQEALGEIADGFEVDEDSGFVSSAEAAENSIDPGDTAQSFESRGRVGGYTLEFTDPDFAGFFSDDPVVTSVTTSLEALGQRGRR